MLLLAGQSGRYFSWARLLIPRRLSPSWSTSIPAASPDPRARVYIQSIISRDRQKSRLILQSTPHQVTTDRARPTVRPSHTAAASHAAIEQQRVCPVNPGHPAGFLPNRASELTVHSARSRRALGVRLVGSARAPRTHNGLRRRVPSCGFPSNAGSRKREAHGMLDFHIQHQGRHIVSVIQGEV